MAMEKEIREIRDMVQTIQNDVHTIKRGVYGDPKNKVRGLIETDLEQHDRIKTLEEHRKKAFWILTGLLIAVEILGWIGKILIPAIL